MNIAIFGPGRIGGGLGKLWSRAGHQVVVTFSRDQAKLEAMAAQGGARAVEATEAARGADVVVLATPGSAVFEALTAAGSLQGKVVIDCTNGTDRGASNSGSEEIARRAEGAKVVKAFNTVFAAIYDEVTSSGSAPDMLFCGDDANAKQIVAGLIHDAGFTPVDYGSLSKAADLDAFTRVVTGLAYGQGMGPFAYWLRRPSTMRSL